MPSFEARDSAPVKSSLEVCSSRPLSPIPVLKSTYMVAAKINACDSHPIRPCENEDCPMFNYEGDYMWIERRTNCRWNKMSASESENWEKIFCHPANWKVENVGSGKNLSDVYFQADGRVLIKRAQGYQIRRLEYEYDMHGNPNEWRWYWLENDYVRTNVITVLPRVLERDADISIYKNTNWLPFSISKYRNPNKLEKGLEAIFKKELPEFRFQNDDSLYIVDFKTGKQTNQQTKTERLVCRRPSTFNLVDCDIIDKGNNTMKMTAKFAVHELVDSDPDLVAIKGAFDEQFIYENIKVYKVKNADLWQTYCLKKEQMTRKLGLGKLNEVLLFHGTKWEVKEQIARENFDPRLSGNQGEKLGKAAYFSPDLLFAAKYCDGFEKTEHMEYFNEADRVMFVALVLMGESTYGDPEDRRPPKKKGVDEMFDSCVEWEHSDSETENSEPPQKIAIFERTQLYPLFQVEMKNSTAI